MTVHGTDAFDLVATVAFVAELDATAVVGLACSDLLVLFCTVDTDAGGRP